MLSTRVMAPTHFAGKLVFRVDSEEPMDPNFDQLKEIPSTPALPVYSGAYYPLTDALEYRVLLTDEDATILNAVDQKVKQLSDQLYKPSILSTSFWAQLFNRTTQHMTELKQQLEAAVNARKNLLKKYIEESERKPREEYFSLENGSVISKADIEQINRSFQKLGLSNVQFTYNPQAKSLAYTP